jgi:hypothetical protein
MEAVRSACDSPAGRVAGPSTFPLLTSVARLAWRRLGIPPAGCRGPATALANEAVVTGVGSHPSVERVPRLPGSTNVVLVRRATTVPFTAVPAGPQRTATDNATAASTCAILYRRRWKSCPIWLCKQGVVGSSPIISTTNRPGQHPPAVRRPGPARPGRRRELRRQPHRPLGVSSPHRAGIARSVIEALTRTRGPGLRWPTTTTRTMRSSVPSPTSPRSPSSESAFTVRLRTHCLSLSTRL